MKVSSIFTVCLYLLTFASCNSNKSLFPEINLFPVKNGAEYQYIDTDGKIVINPQFQQASIFREGLALVKKAGNESKWGFINEKGEYSIPASFDYATVFNDGMAWISIDKLPLSAINHQGEVVFSLEDAEYVRLFVDGLAPFAVFNNGVLTWGFVDKNGVIKVEPQFFELRYFHEGRCAVQNLDKKWGFVNKEGKMVIDFQFEQVSDFANGKASATIGGKCGIIDNDGKFLINPTYTYIAQDGDRFWVLQDGRVGWTDSDEKFIINPQFKSAAAFWGNDLAPAQVNDLWGYIDKDGKFEINPQFEYAYPFCGDVALVSYNKKYGLIDRKGKYVVNPQYEFIADDLQFALQNGQPSRYYMIATDYFNIAKIGQRIKKDLRENTVAGFSLETPTTAILSAYKKSPKDFSIFENTFPLIENEIITNHANLYFYVNSSYANDPNPHPSGFFYIIMPLVDQNNHAQVVIDAIQRALTDFKFSEEESKGSYVVLRNEHLRIAMYENRGNVEIMVESTKVIEPVSEVYGDGSD